MVVDPYEAAIAKVLAAQEHATAAFPPDRIDNHLVHIFEDATSGRWEVWINNEEATFTGLCVGVGVSKGGAIADARIAVLAIAGHLAKLQLADFAQGPLEPKHV